MLPSVRGNFVSVNPRLMLDNTCPDATSAATSFEARPLAENSTPHWSHHLVRQSDETWLPEWSGKLGGVERCAVRSRGEFWGKPVFRLTGLSVGRKFGAGAGEMSARRNEHTGGTEARLTRNGGSQAWSRCLVLLKNSFQEQLEFPDQPCFQDDGNNQGEHFHFPRVPLEKFFEIIRASNLKKAQIAQRSTTHS